jgi:hypothetical protein
MREVDVMAGQHTLLIGFLKLVCLPGALVLIDWRLCSSIRTIFELVLHGFHFI